MYICVTKSRTISDRIFGVSSLRASVSDGALMHSMIDGLQVSGIKNFEDECKNDEMELPHSSESVHVSGDGDEIKEIGDEGSL